MKITKTVLKQLIREELNEIDSDDFRAMQADTSMSGQAPMPHMEINKLVDEAAERIFMEVEKLSQKSLKKFARTPFSARKQNRNWYLSAVLPFQRSSLPRLPTSPNAPLTSQDQSWPM